jgi:AcrR family transcriptional regulator
MTTDEPTGQPTRERILAAALRLFAERGYSATSVGEIEAAAGLSPRSGALYKHFPSKRALLESAFEERIAAIEAFQDQLRDFGPLGDLRAELTLTARWGLAELERERALLRLVMKEGDRIPELAARFREAIVRRGLELATEVIRRYGREQGVEFVDPEAAGEVMCASLVGYSVQQLLFGPDFVGVDDERFVAAWVDAAIVAIEQLERSVTHA